jgi:hypothetical protein
MRLLQGRDDPECSTIVRTAWWRGSIGLCLGVEGASVDEECHYIWPMVLR